MNYTENVHVETDQNYISDDTLERIHTIMDCFIINIISLVGILGNIINIMVLSKHGFSETTNIMLFSLAVCDLLFVTTTVLSKRTSCLISFADEALAETFNTFTTQYIRMFNRTILMVGMTHSSLISVERFVAVYFPFRVTLIFTPWRVKLLIIFLYFHIFIMIFPLLFAYDHLWAFDYSLNQTVAIPTYSNFFISNGAFLNLWGRLIINNTYSTLNIIITSVSCTAIGVRLVQAGKKRGKITSKGANYDAKVVKMLFLICVVTLLAFIPTPIIGFYSYIHPSFIGLFRPYEVFQSIAEALYASNSSFNFFIYVTLSQKYRKTYLQLLHCRNG